MDDNLRDAIRDLDSSARCRDGDFTRRLLENLRCSNRCLALQAEPVSWFARQSHAAQVVECHYVCGLQFERAVSQYLENLNSEDNVAWGSK